MTNNLSIELTKQERELFNSLPVSSRAALSDAVKACTNMDLAKEAVHSVQEALAAFESKLEKGYEGYEDLIEILNPDGLAARGFELSMAEISYEMKRIGTNMRDDIPLAEQLDVSDLSMSLVEGMDAMMKVVRGSLECVTETLSPSKSLFSFDIFD